METLLDISFNYYICNAIHPKKLFYALPLGGAFLFSFFLLNLAIGLNNKLFRMGCIATPAQKQYLITLLNKCVCKYQNDCAEKLINKRNVNLKTYILCILKMKTHKNATASKLRRGGLQYTNTGLRNSRLSQNRNVTANHITNLYLKGGKYGTR